VKNEIIKLRLDAHNHLQTIPIDLKILDWDLVDTFVEKGSISICNGTSPLDWESVALIAEKSKSHVVPYFGVHPWYVENLSDGWLETLKFYLEKYKTGMGEIGLDRAYSSDTVYMLQKEIFSAQMDLAFSLDLPVSIHCFRSWGFLLEVLNKKISHGFAKTIPVMIHSFSGSMETMEELVSKGIYISFSPFLTSRNAEKLKNIFLKTPIEKILIESDFVYNNKNSPMKQISDYYEEQLSLYRIGSKLKNIEADEFRKVVLENGKIFTNRTINRT
jgi:TatD DNase family protein